MLRQFSIHKAAVLVASLDADTADLLLAQMPDAEADAVRDELIRLGDPSPAEQYAVIDEFFQNGSPSFDERSAEQDSHEQFSDLKSHSAGPLQSEHFNSPNLAAAWPRLAESSPDNEASDTGPFSFLNSVEPDSLLLLLTQEQPQAIALVLAHLPHDRAAHVLARLPATVQSDVIRRLVDLDETNPEVLRDVEQAFEKRLTQHASARRQTVGMAAIEAILNASDHASRRQILNNLAAHDRPLAHRLTPPPPTRHFTFDEVCCLPSEAFTRILRAADRRTMILALSGAPAELVESIFDELSPEDAHWISHGLQYLGPFRLTDFHRAQQVIAALADQLSAQGDLPGLSPEHITAMA
jgi:flagellar motor switch protein FliG